MDAAETSADPDDDTPWLTAPVARRAVLRGALAGGLFVLAASPGDAVMTSFGAFAGLAATPLGLVQAWAAARREPPRAALFFGLWALAYLATIAAQVQAAYVGGLLQLGRAYAHEWALTALGTCFSDPRVALLLFVMATPYPLAALSYWARKPVRTALAFSAKGGALLALGALAVLWQDPYLGQGNTVAMFGVLAAGCLGLPFFDAMRIGPGWADPDVDIDPDLDPEPDFY